MVVVEEMAKDSVMDQISLFQRKLQKHARNAETDKVLYYIHKLKYLQVTVKHLEDTGVGRTVNSLRHHEGLVGNKARDLVNKWKKMVSAEDSEEEEEEEEAEDEVDENVDSSHDRQEDDENAALRDQNGDEFDDDEDDRLQIEEDDRESSVPEYKPSGIHSLGYRSGYDSPPAENDNSYNPLTSQKDYQLLNAPQPSAEYHPSSIHNNNSHGSSPEGHENSGWEDASPSLSSAADRSEGKSSSKKSNREEKERHKKKEKEREKDRSREETGSHEKKKDHKHKAKHKEKDKDREKSKSKSHKHKDKEKEKIEDKPKDKKAETSSSVDRHKAEKERKKHLMNGFSTPDRDSHKSHSSKSERDVDDKHRDRGNGSSNGTSNSLKKEEKSHREAALEHESSDSEREVTPKDVKVKTSSSSSSSGKDSRDKSKQQDKHNSSSSSKKRSKHELECNDSERDENGKKKKSKKNKEESDFAAALMGLDSPSKKKKKKKKKDHKERDPSDDEQPSSSSKSSHKRSLTDGSDEPETKKPRLLDSSPQKLPKLPTSIVDADALNLPTITPNYKPLPRVPLRDEPAHLTNSRMSEEEMLNNMLSSKGGRRSKMYSGRVTGLAAVPSLYECCIRVMQENIDAIEATGNIPYHILRPVLERATPQQLLNIEDFNPYLLEDTDSLWENHCKKDFRNKKREDMESFRDMWLRCFDEREKKLRSLTENLQQKFISKAEPKRQTKLAFVGDTVKAPKSVLRAQAKYGTGVPSGSAVKPGKANEIAARKTAMHNAQRAEKAAAAPRPPAAVKKKVAPLMAKTRQFYKKAFRR